MRNKHVGYLILGITFLFILIVFSFNNALEEIVTTNCTHGTSCPMQVTLDTQKVISYGLVSLLLLIGGFVTFFMKDEQVKVERVIEKTVIDSNNGQNEGSSNSSIEEIKKNVESIEDEEEKSIMSLVISEEGSIYQSDLIKKTGLSKVKISRLLDKLEGKGFIERRRRGMTNVVILKR